MAEAGNSLGEVDLSGLNQILDHQPQDLVITAQAGVSLTSLQEALLPQNQWLPVDPANSNELTLGDLVAFNRFGPSLHGYGMIRDHLIGIQVASPDGNLFRSGGKVVKNVAGYDLCKLITGARHSLGVLTEVTFKLRAIPQSSRSFQVACDNPTSAIAKRRELNSLSLPLTVMDLIRSPESKTWSLMITFQGTNAEVNDAANKVERLGFSPTSDQSAFRDFCARFPDHSLDRFWPSKLDGAHLESDAYIHLGAGIIRYATAGSTDSPSSEIHQRLKKQFDPKGVLPTIN